MCSFVTESCPKTQRHILYLKTVNIPNEIETGEAVNKAKNYNSFVKSYVLMVHFWENFSVSSPVSYLDHSGYFWSIYIQWESEIIFCNRFIVQKGKHWWFILPIQQFRQFQYRILSLLLNIKIVSTPPLFVGEDFWKNSTWGIINFCLPWGQW